MRRGDTLPETCERCGDPLRVSSMSYFNDQICCEQCLDDERGAPSYVRAKALELAAVQRGERDHSFGLLPQDRAFLTARLAARRRDLKGFNEAATALGYAILGRGAGDGTDR